MNILNWIINKPRYEYKHETLKRELQNKNDEIERMEKWSKGYQNHIYWLEEEVNKKQEYIKKIKEECNNGNRIKENKDYYGFLNFTFHTEEPTQFIHDFNQYLLQKVGEYSRNIKLVGYDYQPALITANVFSRSYGRQSQFNDEEWELEWLIHQIDHNLETIHMYGDKQQLTKYINRLKQFNDELDYYSREILK